MEVSPKTRASPPESPRGTLTHPCDQATVAKQEDGDCPLTPTREARGPGSRASAVQQDKGRKAACEHLTSTRLKAPGNRLLWWGCRGAVLSRPSAFTDEENE